MENEENDTIGIIIRDDLSNEEEKKEYMLYKVDDNDINIEGNIYGHKKYHKIKYNFEFPIIE